MGNDVVVMDNGPAIVNDNGLETLTGAGAVESVTVTFTVYVPPVEGVPVMVPEDGLIDKVDGSPLALQDNGGVPPFAATGVL